jgi:hypothetical protein
MNFIKHYLGSIPQEAWLQTLQGSFAASTFSRREGENVSYDDFIHWLEEDEMLGMYLVFSDEATFHLNSSVNKKNVLLE